MKDAIVTFRVRGEKRKPPVEEPPNAPRRPPVKEPEKTPGKSPPSPNHPPVEEPPDAPQAPPVKEPPPEDPDRVPPDPPLRRV